MHLTKKSKFNDKSVLRKNNLSFKFTSVQRRIQLLFALFQDCI